VEVGKNIAGSAIGIVLVIRQHCDSSAVKDRPFALRDSYVIW
jgi:hypothetical protein